MQYQGTEDKIGKGALVGDGFEFSLVFRVGLDAQRGGEDKLANGRAEAGEEGVEGLGVDCELAKRTGSSVPAEKYAISRETSTQSRRQSQRL